MAIGKWIGGILGFMSGGPLGALAGIVLGGVFESMLDAVNTPETQGTFDGQSGYESQTYGSMSITDSATVSCSRCSFWLPISSRPTAR